MQHHFLECGAHRMLCRCSSVQTEPQPVCAGKPLPQDYRLHLCPSGVSVAHVPGDRAHSWSCLPACPHPAQRSAIWEEKALGTTSQCSFLILKTKKLRSKEATCLWATAGVRPKPLLGVPSLCLSIKGQPGTEMGTVRVLPPTFSPLFQIC